MLISPHPGLLPLFRIVQALYVEFLLGLSHNLKRVILFTGLFLPFIFPSLLLSLSNLLLLLKLVFQPVNTLEHWAIIAFEFLIHHPFSLFLDLTGSFSQ